MLTEASQSYVLPTRGIAVDDLGVSAVGRLMLMFEADVRYIAQLGDNALLMTEISLI